jgi:membrane associated rhomboid family serine protease
MGRANSDRGSGPGFVQVRIGARFTPGVIALLVLYSVTFLASMVPEAEAFIVHNLLIVPERALGPAPYQLVTGPLCILSLLQLLFLALLLWSIGSAVEQRLGARRLVGYCALSSLAAALGMAAAGRLHALLAPVSLAGRLPLPMEAGPIFLLVLVAFSSIYGGLPVRLWGVGQPISGRALAYFFIGLSLVADLFRGQFEQLFGSVLAIATAAWLCRGHGGGPGLLSSLGSTLRCLSRRASTAVRRRRASHIEVLDGGRSGSGRSGGGQRWLN